MSIIDRESAIKTKSGALKGLIKGGVQIGHHLTGVNTNGAKGNTQDTINIKKIETL